MEYGLLTLEDEALAVLERSKSPGVYNWVRI